MDKLEPLDTGSDDLRINDGLSIPRGELIVRASRAGGPGGQHVNTSSTRVAVTWNVKTSTALSPEQRAAIFSALAAKLTEAGTIRVVARDTRSQQQNRMLAEERLAETIRKALVVRRPRKKTRPTKSAVERRLDSKKVQSRKKRDRREQGDE